MMRFFFSKQLELIPIVSQHFLLSPRSKSLHPIFSQIIVKNLHNTLNTIRIQQTFLLKNNFCRRKTQNFQQNTPSKRDLFVCSFMPTKHILHFANDSWRTCCARCSSVNVSNFLFQRWVCSGDNLCTNWY